MDVKAWLGRVRAAVPAVPGEANASDDSPEALRNGLEQLVRYINRHSGRLPVETVVICRRVTDVVREIIDSADVRALDIHAVVAVQSLMRDYLPTTLGTFLAL